MDLFTETETFRSSMNPFELPFSTTQTVSATHKLAQGKVSLAGLKAGSIALWLPPSVKEVSGKGVSANEVATHLNLFQGLPPLPRFQLPEATSEIMTSKSLVTALANALPLPSSSAAEEEEASLPVVTKKQNTGAFRSLFDAYSRKQLPEVLLIPCNTEAFPTYWLPLARYALLLDQLGFRFDSSNDLFGENASETLFWPKLVLIGSGLQMRLFERGLFEQFKRLTQLKAVQKTLERLCQQSHFRLLPVKPIASSNKEASRHCTGLLSGENQAATRHVQTLLETLLGQNGKPALALQPYCVGPIPAQRLEWHSLWQNEALHKAIKKLPKAEKAAFETVALTVAHKLGLFYPGEPACLEEPSLEGFSSAPPWAKAETALAITLLHGFVQHLGLLTAPHAQHAWHKIELSVGIDSIK